MKPPAVVFDTSVLLSAVGWGGKPLRCLDAAERGIILGFTCIEILDELNSKLQSKLDFTPEQAMETTADLLGILTLVTISGELRVVLADPKDDMIVECAVVAGADFIVSGDRRHLLKMGAYASTKIVSPEALLSAIQS